MSIARILIVATFVSMLAACSTTSTRTPTPNTADASIDKRDSPQSTPRERAAIRLQLAIGYYQDGKYSVALDELKQADALDPTYPEVQMMVAMVYTELGEDARADQSFQRALQLGPLNPDVNNNYGWYLCQRGREKDSLVYFENALKDPLYTQKAKPLQNAGVCAKKMGDAALAETYFRRSFEIDPRRSGRGIQPRAALLRPAGLLAGALLRLAGQQRPGTECGEPVARHPRRAPSRQQDERGRARESARASLRRLSRSAAQAARRVQRLITMEADDGLIGTLHPDTEPVGVGAFLRKRRLALGLTHADIANVVKLPPRRIEALEDERWAELPDGPFLRGFLRNVARALDLDATTLMDRVDESLIRSRNPESILVMPAAMPVTLPRRNGPMDDRHGGRTLVFGAFAFAVAAALIAWSGTESFDRLIHHGDVVARTDATPSATMAARPESTVAAPAAAAPASIVAVTDDHPGATASPETATAPTATGQTAAALSAAQTQPSADVALAFHFNEDSWVEVKSADGRVLMHRLNVAGSDQQVDGEAPYSLIVGNAKGVALRFHGQPVDLGPYTRDQVARLTLS